MTRPQMLRSTAAVLSMALATTILAGLATQALAEERALVIARDMDVNSLDPARALCDTCQIYNDLGLRAARRRSTRTTRLMSAPRRKLGSERRTRREFTFKLDPGGQVLGRLAGRGQGREMVVGAAEEHQGQRAPSLLDPIASIDTPDAADRRRQAVRAQLRVPQQAVGALSWR